MRLLCIALLSFGSLAAVAAERPVCVEVLEGERDPKALEIERLFADAERAMKEADGPSSNSTALAKVGSTQRPESAEIAQLTRFVIEAEKLHSTLENLRLRDQRMSRELAALRDRLQLSLDLLKNELRAAGRIARDERGTLIFLGVFDTVSAALAYATYLLYQSGTDLTITVPVGIISFLASAQALAGTFVPNGMPHQDILSRIYAASRNFVRSASIGLRFGTGLAIERMSERRKDGLISRLRRAARIKLMPQAPVRIESHVLVDFVSLYEVTDEPGNALRIRFRKENHALELRHPNGARINQLIPVVGGDQLIGVANDSVCLWSLSTGELLHHFPFENLLSLRLTEDGKHMLLVDRGGSALAIHLGSGHAVAFVPGIEVEVLHSSTRSSDYLIEVSNEAVWYVDLAGSLMRVPFGDPRYQSKAESLPIAQRFLDPLEEYAEPYRALFVAPDESVIATVHPIRGLSWYDGQAKLVRRWSEITDAWLWLDRDYVNEITRKITPTYPEGVDPKDLRIRSDLIVQVKTVDRDQRMIDLNEGEIRVGGYYKWVRPLSGRSSKGLGYLVPHDARENEDYHSFVKRFGVQPL